VKEAEVIKRLWTDDLGFIAVPLRKLRRYRKAIQSLVNKGIVEIRLLGNSKWVTLTREDAWFIY